ncbi:hypothetical protein N431DRAFT_447379 [Stipitochalara longipes BDJ]|nr:hypothetical protein N431DRAFT_447379 [Stipitochalara longipes BDJ]
MAWHSQAGSSGCLSQEARNQGATKSALGTNAYTRTSRLATLLNNNRTSELTPVLPRVLADIDFLGFPLQSKLATFLLAEFKFDGLSLKIHAVLNHRIHRFAILKAKDSISIQFKTPNPAFNSRLTNGWGLAKAFIPPNRKKKRNMSKRILQKNASRDGLEEDWQGFHPVGKDRLLNITSLAAEVAANDEMKRVLAAKRLTNSSGPLYSNIKDGRLDIIGRTNSGKETVVALSPPAYIPPESVCSYIFMPRH